MSDTAARRLPTPALNYDGQVGELYRIFFKNLLLTVLTLGIYRFWAITNYRRYFWSRMACQNERFTYTGTGGQLFAGFVLAGLLLIGGEVVLAIAAAVLSTVWRPLMALPLVAGLLAVTVLAGGAVFSAQRYRLSRTTWHGVEGGMDGSMLSYGWRVLAYSLLAMATLLQMVPWMQVRLAERRINASWLGNLRFRFQGRARDVYLSYLLAWAGCVVLLLVIGAVLAAGVYPLVLTLAASRGNPVLAGAAVGRLGWVLVSGYLVFLVLATLLGCWYSAVLTQHVIGHTALGRTRLASSVTGSALLGLVAGNLLILVCTLGFGLPFVLNRNAAFLARTLWICGPLDVTALQRADGRMTSYGEGLFQQLDGGGIL